MWGVALAAVMLAVPTEVTRAMGVDFGLDGTKAAVVGFEVDTSVSADETDEPLQNGLFLAWQSEMVDPSGHRPTFGGHWGFQMFPYSHSVNGSIHTFNFGWGMENAILPTGLGAPVRSARDPQVRMIDTSARMKAEIESRIKGPPDQVNLFLAYVGAQGGLPGTKWPEALYHQVDWQFNQWYLVRFVRDQKPSRVHAWVLRREGAAYSFGRSPEATDAYAWRITLTPEVQKADGSFSTSGQPIAIAPFFLSTDWKYLHTFNSWGEALGGTPLNPVCWRQVRPRLILEDGTRQDVPKALAGFWGFDQPDFDAGPIGDSRLTHSFYAGYRGKVKTSDGRLLPIMQRSVRDAAVLWDDKPGSGIDITDNPATVPWDEGALSRYLRGVLRLQYASEIVRTRTGFAAADRRLLLNRAGTRLEFSAMFGGSPTGVEFKVHANDQGWLQADATGFSVQPNANGGAPFHVEIEAFRTGSSNALSWLDLVVTPPSSAGH
jgi:hypothetical protein